MQCFSTNFYSVFEAFEASYHGQFFLHIYFLFIFFYTFFFKFAFKYLETRRIYNLDAIIYFVVTPKVKR